MVETADGVGRSLKPQDGKFRTGLRWVACVISVPLNGDYISVLAVTDCAPGCPGDHPWRDGMLRVRAPPCGGLRNRRANLEAGGRLRGLPSNHYGCAPAIDACMRTTAACDYSLTCMQLADKLSSASAETAGSGV